MGTFHYKLWLIITLANIILDFGRPIAMIHLHSDSYFPANLPSVGDYFHMAYNLILMLCLTQMMNSAAKFVPTYLRNIILSLFLMGATIHLVGDSVNHRLALFGYQHHLSLHENEIMKSLKPKELVNVFELMYFYDEVLGHYMWYFPLFLCYLFYFNGSFVSVTNKLGRSGIIIFILSLLGGLYNWYLGAEGQITPLILSVWLIMSTIMFMKRLNGQIPNLNARYLYYSFTVGLLLTLVWSLVLSDDVVMRKKYPGWFYVPEPWSVYSDRIGIV